MSDQFTSDGYTIIPRLPEPNGIKGIQCGECGMKFDNGKAYRYCCPNNRCPVQMKPMCGGSYS